MLDSARTRRGDAASDRRQAGRDRSDGARERLDAELDRDTASADRAASARDRMSAGTDRDTARTARTAAAEARAAATHDGLTGLLMRDAGLIELDREIARSRRTGDPLVVAFIDIDKLKAVNDRHGHAAGDRVLVEVASTLRSSMRGYDLLIRFGGDEFLCALPGMTMTVARARLAAISAALETAPERSAITAGLAELEPGDVANDLIARADAALYQQRR